MRARSNVQLLHRQVQRTRYRASHLKSLWPFRRRGRVPQLEPSLARTPVAIQAPTASCSPASSSSDLAVSVHTRNLVQQERDRVLNADPGPPCIALPPELAWPQPSKHRQKMTVIFEVVNVCIVRRMPRMQVYLPDDLHAAVKEHGFPASEMLQNAVREELRRIELIKAGEEYLEMLRAEVGPSTPEPGATRKSWARDGSGERSNRRSCGQTGLPWVTARTAD